MTRSDPNTEADLWFMPGPLEDEAMLRAPLPEAGERESAIVAQWAEAEAAAARPLAELAGRFGALDDRLRRGPEGWRHRLALIEASDMAWLSGTRVMPDRLALWVALRLSSVQQDMHALQRSAWAFRSLAGGIDPEDGLAGFLGRYENTDTPALSERLEGWQQLVERAGRLHPLTRAAMGLALWPDDDGTVLAALEGAVVAARLGATGAQGGAVFLPLAMGGGSALRCSGPPDRRLAQWLSGAEAAVLAAMRVIDRIESWDARASAEMARLSGRTPGRLREVLRDWPLVSAPMAETLTGASRAAIQRNIAWFEARDLVQEVTGQGRFRFWRARF